MSNNMQAVVETQLSEFKISPEIFEVATCYVKTLDIKETAKELGLTLDQVTGVLDKREVKKYIDHIFLEQGYMHRHKLNDVMTRLIDQKLEDMQETGLGSDKDIIDILTLQHKMRMDYAKVTKEEAAEPAGSVTNIQNNFGGDNYSKLMTRIVEGNNDSK